MRILGLVIIYSFFGSISAIGQDTLTLIDLFKQISGNHPMEKSANLTFEMSQLELLQARGAFDPKLSFNHAQKDFKGTEYYNQNKAELKIPTWYGIELKGGYEINTGQYLNPENTSTLDGLSYAEISIPLLQHLLIDERRAQLNKAHFNVEVGNSERQLLINELYMYIGLAYWNWYEIHEVRRLYSQAVEVANARLKAVKRSVELGSYAVIDTVEAFMELSRRRAVLKELDAQYIAASNQLLNHIWTKDSTQFGLSQPSFKLPFPTTQLEVLIDSFVLNQHPSINKINQKISANQVDQKLYKQQFLPDVRLSYKPLVSGTNISQYSAENYTLGATAQIPILYRKERAKYQMSTIKGEQLNQELDLKLRSLVNDLNTYSESLTFLTQMLEYQEQMVNASAKMLETEKRRFQLGDATIFMINYRERYLLESQMKLIKTKKELAKTHTILLNKLGVDVMTLLNN